MHSTLLTISKNLQIILMTETSLPFPLQNFQLIYILQQSPYVKCIIRLFNHWVKTVI